MCSLECVCNLNIITNTVLHNFSLCLISTVNITYHTWLIHYEMHSQLACIVMTSNVSNVGKTCACPYLYLQARCRGWLGRHHFKRLKVQDSAARVIQQNMLSHIDVKDWSWWDLFMKVRIFPLSVYDTMYTYALH